MTPLVPPTARTLAPIPRIHYRRVEFGSDPALPLAQALSRRCQLPVSRLLGPRWLGSAHAGPPRSAPKVGFRCRRRSLRGTILVDDVITTGTTLRTTVETPGGGRVDAAVTATASLEMRRKG